MKPRKCSLRLVIDNGVSRFYCVRPLAGAELPTPFVAGFHLREMTQPSHPVYLVRLSACGAVNCSCPQWQRGAEKCKHADALVAAGLLPVHLVQLIAERTKLLDEAEKKLAEETAKKPRARRKKNDK